MSPYYFLPIVVAVLNPPSLQWTVGSPPSSLLPTLSTDYRVTHSHSLSDGKCKKVKQSESSDLIFI